MSFQVLKGRSIFFDIQWEAPISHQLMGWPYLIFLSIITLTVLAICLTKRNGLLKVRVSGLPSGQAKLRKTVCQRKQLSEILFDDKTRTTSKVAHYDDLNKLQIPASTKAVDVKVTLTFGEN